MGYLNNSTISVDAILTKAGRAALAKGDGSFNITQYAVADDEVDYSLYTPNHPLGTAYYGAIIENMPLLEASTDETQNMRFKLVSLPVGTTQIPIISIGFNSIVLTSGVGATFPFMPTTPNGLNSAAAGGYSCILLNSAAAVLTGTGLPTTNQPTVPNFLGSFASQGSIVATGTSFILTPKNVTQAINTTLVIYGVETGASITVPLTVNPAPSV